VLGAVFAVALCATVLYFLGSGAVLLQVADRRGATRGNILIVFNPLRDRAPERHAEAFLAKLGTGNCSAAFEWEMNIHSGDSPSYTCSHEMESRLVRWTLADRTDLSPLGLRLRYRCWRTSVWGTYDAPEIDLVLAHTGGDWRVVSYDTWY
jgi:hypothetical protein